jgi:hypothetical protein
LPHWVSLGGRGGVAAAAAEDGLDAQQQLAHAEWLGDVVVGAELEADDAVDLVAARADHDHGDAAGALAHPQVAADLGAGHVGQHPVEEDEVRRTALAEEAHRGRAVLARPERGVTLALEAVAQGLDQVLLVIDEEDRAGHET